LKLYGYANADGNDKLLEMKSVAICFQSPEGARKFADFVNACAEEMKALGTDYDHVHFAGGDIPDITIERLVDAGGQ